MGIAHERERDPAFQEFIRSHFKLDEDGETIWKVHQRTGVWVRVTANPSRHGYVQVTVCGFSERMINMRYHRLVWFLAHGQFPKNEIDHIDRNKSNNQLSNLREVTTRENQLNCYQSQKKKPRTSSRYLGVSFFKQKQEWAARIREEGKDKHLGYFDNELQAALARDEYIQASNQTARYKLNFPLIHIVTD